MQLWQYAVIAVAGMLAGMINAVVGSGTLITFPVLLAFHYPPVVANVSNGLGLVPGSVAGAYGYRRELAGQRPRLIKLGIASALGAIVGAVLLLKLPPDTFQAVVPVLIVVALVLVVIQPWLARKVAARRPDGHTGGPSRRGPLHEPWPVPAAVPDDHPLGVAGSRHRPLHRPESTLRGDPPA